jgi:hypothetical protein
LLLIDISDYSLQSAADKNVNSKPQGKKLGQKTAQQILLIEKPANI